MESAYIYVRVSTDEQKKVFAVNANTKANEKSYLPTSVTVNIYRQKKTIVKQTCMLKSRYRKEISNTDSVDFIDFKRIVPVNSAIKQNCRTAFGP